MKHQKKKSTTTLEKPTKKLEKESHPEEDNNNNNAEVGDQKQQAGEKQPGEQFGYIFPDQRAVEVVNPTIYDNDENKGEATNKRVAHFHDLLKRPSIACRARYGSAPVQVLGKH